MTWHETTDWSHVLAGGSAMWNSPQIIKCALEIHLSIANHKILLFGVGVLAMAQNCHVVNVCGPVYMMFNDALTQLHIKAIC